MKNNNRQKYKKLDLKMKCKLPNETKHSEYIDGQICIYIEKMNEKRIK